jgi:predicted negative regulator of RcsB-dependent stress response
MNKLKEISDAIKQWIKDNPKSALVIGVFIAGFILGSIIF